MWEGEPAPSPFGEGWGGVERIPQITWRSSLINTVVMISF
jgi:hypothetical protein